MIFETECAESTCQKLNLNLTFILIACSEVENLLKSLEEGYRGGDAHVEIEHLQDLRFAGDERLSRDVLYTRLSLK